MPAGRVIFSEPTPWRSNAQPHQQAAALLRSVDREMRKLDRVDALLAMFMSKMIAGKPHIGWSATTQIVKQLASARRASRGYLGVQRTRWRAH
jgi:hypothetical protein